LARGVRNLIVLLAATSTSRDNFIPEAKADLALVSGNNPVVLGGQPVSSRCRVYCLPPIKHAHKIDLNLE